MAFSSLDRQMDVAQFADYVQAYNFGTIPPTRLVLHHTAIPNQHQWRGMASLIGIKNFYIGKGWTRGPHLFVAGKYIYLMTPMSEIGIHAGTGNSGVTNGKLWYSIGLEVVWDGDKSPFGGETRATATAVMGLLVERLGIAPQQLISQHRDYTNTKSCPGKYNSKQAAWADVSTWLAARHALPMNPRAKRGAVVRTSARIEQANVVRQASAGEPLTLVARVQGQLAGGSDVWYQTADNKFIHTSGVQ